MKKQQQKSKLCDYAFWFEAVLFDMTLTLIETHVFCKSLFGNDYLFSFQQRSSHSF
jgi:hypothetical protein